MIALIATLLLAVPVGESDDVLRDVIADVAVAQINAPSTAWNPHERDCAGLVRFAYKQAYAKVRPERVQHGPLFVDADKNPTAFANAETLALHNFRALGRDEQAMRAVKTGDLLVYRHDRSDDPSVDGAVWHLMMAIVLPTGDVRVVYHPGQGERGEPPPPVKHGTLRSLRDSAPLGWRPDVNNPAFLGFFRFMELR